MVRIRTGETERIQITALDGSLAPVTGVTDLKLSIQRVSDNYYYDFDDDTFKGSGWTSREQALTEVSATNSPGDYRYDWNTSAITNPQNADAYQVYIRQTPGSTVKNVPQTGEIRVGKYVGDLPTSV